MIAVLTAFALLGQDTYTCDVQEMTVILALVSVARGCLAPRQNCGHRAQGGFQSCLCHGSEETEKGREREREMKAKARTGDNLQGEPQFPASNQASPPQGTRSC